MAVNGVEIKVGQKWRVGGSSKAAVVIENHRDDHFKHVLAWNDQVAGVLSIVVDDNGYPLGGGVTGKLIELIEDAPAPAKIDANELAAETLQSLGWHFVGNCWVQDAQPEQQVPDELRAARKTLESIGYTYHGGELWKPPLGASPKADEMWKKHARELVRWRTRMSYNDSYFSEPAGMLKHVVLELERLIDDKPKVAASNAPEKDEPPASGVTEHPLYPVVVKAIEQAMFGKGERHGGNTTPFLEQPWVHYAKMHGRGFLTGQAAKKLEEAASKRTGEAFETEVLGAMVYAGMAVLFERGDVK